MIGTVYSSMPVLIWESPNHVQMCCLKALDGQKHADEGWFLHISENVLWGDAVDDAITAQFSIIEAYDGSLS